jgi:hypothetical protein
LNYWIANHPGIAFKKQVAIELGGYPSTGNKFAEDYPFWCKFLLAGHQIYNMPDPLIYYRVLNNSNSKKMRRGENIKWLKSWRDKL